MAQKVNRLTPFVPGVRRSTHPYGKLFGVRAILPQRPCASLTLNNFLRRLRLLNYNFENSALCGHIWVTVKPTASKQCVCDLSVSYYFNCIYCFRDIFCWITVWKNKFILKKIANCMIILHIKKIFLFLKFPCENHHFTFFFTGLV